jgi:hypothetical protein
MINIVMSELSLTRGDAVTADMKPEAVAWIVWKASVV